jgi:hypothetical protein
MQPSEIFEKRILISPLNWGMGHVSRCIPLIKKLINQKNQLFIACSNDQKRVFKSYFDSEIVYIDHFGYPFRFNGRGNFILDILSNMLDLKKRHETELAELNNLIREFRIDIIVSDHRYGFRSNKCLSIFMTHQLQLPLPWYFKVAQIWHKKQVSKFDYQWIVDDEIIRLAGNLSNNSDFKNALFIGYLSRFEGAMFENEKLYNGILIMSGPCEYFLDLFQHFKNQIKSGEIDLIIGNDKALEIYKSLNLRIEFQNSNDWKKTDNLILKANKIFGYCGYSTLMDLHFLGCDSELIACSGQLEQLYLQKKVLGNSQDFK